MEDKVHVLAATAGESRSDLAYLPMLFSVPRSQINTFACLPHYGKGFGIVLIPLPMCPTLLLFAIKSDILFPSECDVKDVLKLQELSVCYCFLCCIPSRLPPGLFFAPIWRLEQPFSHTGFSGLIYLLASS